MCHALLIQWIFETGTPLKIILVNRGEFFLTIYYTDIFSSKDDSNATTKKLLK